MSRFIPDRDINPILRAAEHWKRVGLENQGSVFDEQPVWTVENLAALQTHFVENLDYGEGNFLGKLKAQLQQAPPGAKKLMAEMLSSDAE